MSTIVKRNLRTVHLSVAAREDFDCNGTLEGTHSSHLRWANRLTAELAAKFDADSKALDFYVVYSYETPIAWYANGVWFETGQKHSPTTSRHQSALRLYNVR